MDIIRSIVFGIVEGITEWLPISSTGHMILLNTIWPFKSVSAEFYSMYEVVIQFGAILAVVVVFWNKIWPFGREDNRYPFSEYGIGSYIKKDKIILWLHILVSCIPAAVIGLLLDDFIEKYFYNYIVVAIMLIVFGIAFIYVETVNRGIKPRIRKVSGISYKVALYIGIFQLIAAIFPGTSRSGATIIGALLLGVSRVAAAEYTFYLAIPVMLGASVLKIFKYGLAFTFFEIVVLFFGMVVAFFVSIFAIRFLMNFVKNHNFKGFGVYRIILGLLVLVLGICGVLSL